MVIAPRPLSHTVDEENRVTIPQRDEIGHNEVLLTITGEFDELGRVRFVAYWLGTDAMTPPTGVRAQVSCTNLKRYVEREHRSGRTVRGYDAATRAALADL